VFLLLCPASVRPAPPGPQSGTERPVIRTEPAPHPAQHRQVPLYRRRNDAESINRALDDSLWLRRAHSVGHERQHLNLLTYALVVNSLALHRHRQRSSDPPLTAAA
jgi:hypothetical protein